MHFLNECPEQKSAQQKQTEKESECQLQTFVPAHKLTEQK